MVWLILLIAIDTGETVGRGLTFPSRCACEREAKDYEPTFGTIRGVCVARIRGSGDKPAK